MITLEAGIQNMLYPLKRRDVAILLKIFGESHQEWLDITKTAANLIRDTLGLDQILISCLSQYYFDPLKYQNLIEKVIKRKWDEWLGIWITIPTNDCPDKSRLLALIDAAKHNALDEWTETLSHVRKCGHCQRLCIWFLQKQRHRGLCHGDCMSCPVKDQCPEWMQ